MKYLKNYKIFEKRSEIHLDTSEIFLEFFEEFGYKMAEYSNNDHLPFVFSSKYGTIEISDIYHFGAKCLRIRITDSSTVSRGSGGVLNPGNYKNFDGIKYEKYSEKLEECHLRMIRFLDPVEVIVGSIGVYTKDLDLLYFYEKPNFKRYKGVDIYGSNIAVSLDKLDISLSSNSRHDNCFSAYRNNRVVDMFYISGSGYDGDVYYSKICDDDKNDKKLCEWIESEWKSVCDKLKIKDYQKIRNYNNPKITMAEFLHILKKNQDNYFQL